MLSFAGRVILIKHVLQSLPIHILRVVPIPSVCIFLEKWMRNFFWSGGPEHAKRSLLNWNSVCRPKSKGGLGFRRIKDMISANSVRLGWTAVSSSSLWASWFRAKYLKGFSPWHLISLSIGSCIWRLIKRSSHFLFQNNHWILGDGKSISFWHDKWHGPLSLAQVFPYMDFSWSDSVNDILSNPQRLSSMSFPQQVAAFSSTLLATFSLVDEPDALIWSSSNSSHLSFSAAWESIRPRSLPRVWHQFA